MPEDSLARVVTRDDVRKALACPVCKTPGVLLGDKCERCGSYQDADGQWITPSKIERKDQQNHGAWDWQD